VRPDGNVPVYVLKSEGLSDRIEQKEYYRVGHFNILLGSSIHWCLWRMRRVVIVLSYNYLLRYCMSRLLTRIELFFFHFDRGYFTAQ
jgi:hypothetical protein